MALQPYRELFRDRELRRIVFSSILPRLPAGINGLAITVSVQSLYGSLAVAGSVSSVYLMALGVAAPFVGRFVDQNGPRKAVLPFGLLHAIAIVMLAVAAMQRVAVPALMAFAFIAGIFFPPVSMTVRAMWRKSTLPDSSKQLGFALEGVIMESIFVMGPLLVSAFLLAKHPIYALVFSAVVMLTGIAMFVRSGAIARWGQVEVAERHWLGPLLQKGVRRALVVSLLVGACFGLQEVGMIAASKAAGKEHFVGWLFAAFSIPSAIAGLLYGTRQFAMPLNRQMCMGLFWIAALSALLALTSNLLIFAALCFLCGTAVGPVITASQLQLGKLTPSEYSTEAFTWAMTIFMIALGGAFLLGGWLTENVGAWACMAAASCVATLAALQCLIVPEIIVPKTVAPE